MKKKLLVWGNFSKLNSGFGGHKKRVLRWFHQQPDWEVVEAAAGLAWDAPECQKMPWKCYGLAPDSNQQAQINAIQDENKRIAAQKDANYGALKIDEVIKLEKPDYFYTIEDSWCYDSVVNKEWNDVLPTFYHITFDSLPFLPQQIDMAGKCKYLYSWASFAEDEYKRLGYDHVKTIGGSVDDSLFRPISKERRSSLRKKFGLEDAFVFLKLGRSQLRKHYPNLLDGFKIFKSRNPSVKAKLLFHTHWGEGWNLPQLIKDKGIDPNDVLTTYYCRACREWEIRPFFGLNQDCPHCHSKNTYSTCDIINGVTDEDVADIYGISDMVFNLISSGGYELAVWQAKLCEKIVATPDYSCGKDAVGSGTGGWKVDWATYMEPGSQFVKSTSLPESVCENMERFVNLSKEERVALEKEARNFALGWSSTESVCQKLKAEFKKVEPTNWENFDWTPKKKNPLYQPPPNLSPEQFVLCLFRNVLNEKVDKNNSQVKFWTEHLEKTKDYQGTYNHFVNQAAQFNAQLDQKEINFGDLLNKSDKKRLLICMPESAGDVLMVNSLVPKVQKQYPEFAIYFATKPQFKEFVEHLEGVTWLPYNQGMEDVFWLTGKGSHEGFFDIAFLCQGQTQRFMNYQWRREDLRPEWINNVSIGEKKTQ